MELSTQKNQHKMRIYRCCELGNLLVLKKLIQVGNISNNHLVVTTTNGIFYKQLTTVMNDKQLRNSYNQ